MIIIVKIPFPFIIIIIIIGNMAGAWDLTPPIIYYYGIL
jgi:hypothetical protein